MFNVGAGELIFILVAALVVLGPKQLPEFARAIGKFVRESEVVFALLLHPTGQVMAQHGFHRALDIMAACALASAIHASSQELGRMLDGKPPKKLVIVPDRIVNVVI